MVSYFLILFLFVLQIVDLGADHAIGGTGINEDTYFDGAGSFNTASSTINTCRV